MSRELSKEGLNQLEGCAQEQTAYAEAWVCKGWRWMHEESGSSRRSGVQRTTYIGSVLKRSVWMACDTWGMEATQGEQASAAVQQQLQWLRPGKRGGQIRVYFASGGFMPCQWIECGQ